MQTAAQVLTQSLTQTPSDIIVIGTNAEGDIWATWSDMSTEKLVYLKDIFVLAISGHVSRSVIEDQKMRITELTTKTKKTKPRTISN